MNTIRPEDLEALLAATHPVLRAAGAEQGIWSQLTCTCGRPECEIDDPERHSVTLQLDALAAYWKPDGATATVAADLADALRRLADVLGLWGDASAPGGTLPLLHAVRDRWLARMGTPLGGPPGESWMRDLHRVEARNGLLLDQLLAALVAVPFTRIANAGAAHARQRLGRAAQEGVTACKRALMSWLDDHATLPQRTLLQEHLLAIIYEAQWTPGEAQDVVQMAEDAAHAVLAFGIADEMWVKAAYGRMEQVVPLSSIRVALVLQDDPVPVPR